MLCGIPPVKRGGRSDGHGRLTPGLAAGMQRVKSAKSNRGIGHRLLGGREAIANPDGNRVATDLRRALPAVREQGPTDLP